LSYGQAIADPVVISCPISHIGKGVVEETGELMPPELSNRLGLPHRRELRHRRSGPHGQSAEATIKRAFISQSDAVPRGRSIHQHR